MPRRKISAKASGLPKLTAKQMKFCECILAGMSQRASYRASHDASSMSDAAVDVAASRLRHHAKIALWLDAARYDALTDFSCTFEGHLQELARLKAICVRTGNLGAAVQAEQLRGKAAGHYVEQVRHLTDHDPHAILNKIAQLDPEYARALARKHELVDWQPQGETRH